MVFTFLNRYVKKKKERKKSSSYVFHRAQRFYRLALYRKILLTYDLDDRAGALGGRRMLSLRYPVSENDKEVISLSSILALS